jgi:hypothetical protein
MAQEFTNPYYDFFASVVEPELDTCSLPQFVKIPFTIEETGDIAPIQHQQTGAEDLTANDCFSSKPT